MGSREIFGAVRRRFEHALLDVDAASALRGASALVVAWLACLLLGYPALAAIAATTAHNVATLQVRGDYLARVAILCILTLAMAAWVFAGTLAGPGVVWATVLTGLLAVTAGAWRHASGDYGPAFAVGTALLYFLSLAQPGDLQHGLHMACAALGGGVLALLIQSGVWWFRPQHALRHSVAEVWVTVSDLIENLKGSPEPESQMALAEKENALRATIDRTLQALTTSRHTHAPLLAHLDEATQLGARLATRVSALNTALGPLRDDTNFAKVELAIELVLEALVNTTRSVALALLTHRPEQFLALKVRIQRTCDLLQVVDQRLAKAMPPGVHVERCRELLGQVVVLLPTLRNVLAETVDQGAPTTTAAVRLPELSRFSLASFGAWLSPPAEIDSVLVRYTLRVGVLMMAAIAAYRGFDLPRGHWIAFTILIVLQPDYGATRLKAGQRILGTLAGTLVGSLLLWLRMPLVLQMTAVGILAFLFTYFVRRRYGLAVFLVTLMLVLMTEAMTPIHLDFTIARLLATLIGGVLALLAAYFLWPKWEQERSPSILAEALRANRVYLLKVAQLFAEGSPFSGPAIQVKREAERANSRATASLQRLLAEPNSDKDQVTQTAAVTLGIQRLTRSITVLGQHLFSRVGKPTAEVTEGLSTSLATLELLAGALEAKATLSPFHHDPKSPVSQSSTRDPIMEQVARIQTEVEALTVETKE